MLRPPGLAGTDPPSRRLRLGGFELDLDARELLRPGGRRGKRITAKAQQVLLELALRPGEVLSRDALMDAVWPDSYPTGDVLTQAIVQLRRALDDDVEAPQYIETIAKSGYRLLAEVTWLPTPTAGEAMLAVAAEMAETAVPAATEDAPAAAPDRRTGAGSRLSRFGIGAAVLMALLVLVPWLWRAALPPPDAGPPAPSAQPPRLLTAQPGDERSPAPSPDGSQFVFVAGGRSAAAPGLYLQGLDSYLPRRLTSPPEGLHDDVPAWSPDGRWVAFRRAGGMIGSAQCELWQVTVVAGEARLLAPCEGQAMGIAVSPDGTRLIVGGRRYAEQSGLRELDIRLGTWRALPVEGPADEWETGPRVSADGRWLLFRRGVNTADLWRVPIDGGQPEALTRLGADLRGHDWLGAGGAVVFGLVDERGSWLMRLDGAGALPRPLIEAGGAPRAFANGERLLYEQASQRYQVKQYVQERSALEAPVGIGSSRSELLPSLSLDGRQLAFYSDRSGRLGLWLADLGHPNLAPVPVEGLVPRPRFAPVWHPDGTHLLVVADGDDGDGLYEVAVATRRARRVPLPLSNVAFALYRDGQRLLVNSREDSGYALRLYARDNGSPLSDAVIRGIGYAQVDAGSGRLLYTSEERFGLFSATLDLAGPGLLRDDLLPPPLYRAWRVAGDQLWLLRRPAAKEGIELWRLPLAELGADKVGAAIGRIDVGTDLINDLAVSGDGRRLLLTVREGSGIDVALLDLSSPLEAPP